MRLRSIHLLLLTLVMLSPSALAQHLGLAPEQIKLEELLRDTQKNNIAIGEVEIVWWIPAEYWRAALAQQPDVPAEMREEFLSLFRDYNVVANVHMRMDRSRADAFGSEVQARSGMSLIDPSGTSHAPVVTAELPPRLVGVLAYVKPILASMMGPTGENMHFVVFPGRDSQGRRLIEPLGDGQIKIKAAMDTYAFRLPLGSLLPPQRDAASGESFPGDYRYNPYTGDALQAVSGP